MNEYDNSRRYNNDDYPFRDMYHHSINLHYLPIKKIKEGINMDYEQKYTEALERAKKFYNNEECRVGMTPVDLEVIFPELKEPEDEKMWKLIKKYARYNISDSALESDHITREHLESWLEKQGEQIDIANKEYWRGYREGKKEILDKYAELEKQGEQKYSWSEEDEYLLDETIRHLEELIRIDKAKHCGVDVQYYQRDIDWLKSTKDRIQSMQSDKPQGKSAPEAIQEENVDNAKKVENKQKSSSKDLDWYI